jgi:membrane-associated PAP2 superfamily phosphatase
MDQDDRPRFNWAVIVLFAPIVRGWFLVQMLRPQWTRHYIIAAGVVWIVALVVYMIVQARRGRRGMP